MADADTLTAMKPHSTTRVVPAGEFKTRCLRLMDEVDETGEEVGALDN